MTKRVVITRLLCTLLCALALLFPAHAFAQTEELSWDQLFRTQIGEWKNTIVAQDPQFGEWKNAEMEVQTLGANQHQWLISLSLGNKQVGYMVVGEVASVEKQKKFVLLEYGLGEYILFDDAFAPREVAAEPVYDGFASHWLVTLPQAKQVVDAKTGERYLSSTRPDDSIMCTLQEQDLATAGQKLLASRIIRPDETDPFDNISWFTPLVLSETEVPPSQLTWDELWQRKSDQMTLAVRLYHAEVLSPYSIASLHLWNDQKSYIGVWDDGLRFLPYAYANKVGKIHIQ
ncbi:hypothetical protein NDK47_16005 [Brevibacillus ruminantium]|uniref:Uncharacterized protein n=1 Tax=Brevibacillus ruminantium TaxID=2950604 RepID=A0ABY4WCN5_9BACL|nr:hypothetical protein [Brevibacillus ruminantium]USG63677.1 hypothetical protein NDK47_16005 [Brevibacillus ruminantium]